MHCIPALTFERLFSLQKNVSGNTGYAATQIKTALAIPR